MPSLGLALGAGAGQGLEQALTRLMEEAKFKQLQKAQEETARSHMANEGIDRERIASTERERISRDAMMQKNYQDAADSRVRDDGRALGDEIPYGSVIAPNDPAGSLMDRAGVGGSLLRGMKANVATPLDEPNELGGEATVSSDPDMAEFKGKELAPGSRIKLRSFKQKEEEDKRNKEGAGYNTEVKTVLYKGQPVDAIFDPRKQTFTHPNGTDITAEVGDHYTPPDRTLVQTGDSYDTRPNVTRRINAGENVPLAETASTRTMSEGAKMLLPKAKGLEADATELEKRGMFGPFMSRVRDIMAKAGTTLDSDNPDEAAAAWKGLGSALNSDANLSTDRLTGKFAASLGLLATGAGRVHGGARGGSSSMMLTHFKDLLSSSSTLDMFLGRLDALNGYLEGYAAGPGGGTKKKDDEGDIFQQYLNRTKK